MSHLTVQPYGSTERKVPFQEMEDDLVSTLGNRVIPNSDVARQDEPRRSLRNRVCCGCAITHDKCLMIVAAVSVVAVLFLVWEGSCYFTNDMFPWCSGYGRTQPM